LAKHYISEILKNVKVSDKTYAKCLQEVGIQRIQIVEFFKKFNKFNKGSEYVILIGDKGFYSVSNEKELHSEKIHYILPLKRNSSLIDYMVTEHSRSTLVNQGNKKTYDGYFIYEDQVIWYYRKKGERSDVIVFIDKINQSYEEKDYLQRIENKYDGYSLETFYEKQHTIGTIAIITDLTDLRANKCYNYYKNRNQIETMIDTFKNMIDKTEPV